MAGVGEEGSYELPITQAELADAVGLTPVHVDRTLRSLERDGLITRSTFRSIVIDDWMKLADAGDFDTNYLHLKEDQRAAA
jgi:CRP-like cAMP-binding protein